ncbi:hypothetical protein [Bacillus sp. OK048]|uniref:hypothetical protein n=1 Tax=Bacillus sp. OK048 TaxID=1882761 RepID=UPI001C31BF70|nr:hypothetical protein [Bacillus sp. OK048]
MTYFVGVPTAHLQLEIGLQNQQTQLTEANISWSSSSGDVEETIDKLRRIWIIKR